ncbi:ubiquitin carboxyl-terminal hydrolase 8 [Elysia marginata]|uniref:Ubiquitin carboxyl-terminal hydrolase 8 n=1 Tax=Elysia marginata TaxID=1093978 RepID=A0AAV4HHC2_9GAST|nr:ubiquitin carboxyl-terminal hydrolase 8 [Elysia marginata]
MPSATSKKKDLYLGKCLDDLNKLTEIQPLGNNVNVIVRSSKKVFQEAEFNDAKGDEERSYVLYLKYFNIITQIKQKAEYKKQKAFFDDIIGKINQTKAISRAEDLSASLKERYDFKEAEAVAKKWATTNPGKTVSEKKKNDDLEPTRETKENEHAAAKVDKPPPVEGSIECTSLCSLLRDTATKVIIMDVRKVEDFSQSHISNPDCINVPEDIIIPGSTVSHIQSKLPQDSLEIWQQRKHADFIVLLDWGSSLDQVKIGTPLRTLKDALFKFDIGTVIKSEPLVLEKGYENWLLLYPTITTNAHVVKPNAKTDDQLPSPTTTLNFEYPVLDDQLQKIVPAAANNIAPRAENLTTSQVSSPEVPDKSIPRVDRSLKPSALVSPDSNFNQAIVKTVNNDSPQDVILNNNIYPSFETIAAKPSVNTRGVKNTNLPSNAGDRPGLEPKGFTLSVKNDLAQNFNERTESWKESKDLKLPNSHKLIEDKSRLEETEQKLRDLELIKKKEEKNVADLMRMKRKLVEEINAEKKMKDQDRLAVEEQKR